MSKSAAPTPFIKKGDRFTDAQGKTWEVWNARTSLIEAFPVIDGKVKVNNQDGQQWATDARAKSANQEARTDFNPIQQKPQGVTPQVLTNAAAERIISAAADSVKTLRKSDVGRVLDETPATHKLSMATYIKENRRDLADEVDSVMAEAQPAAESKPTTDALNQGDVFITTAGRETTPFPKCSKNPGKAQSTKDEKTLRQWLKDNAIAEAKARNDRFNLVQFESLNINNWSQSDGDSVNLYLFDDETGRIGNRKKQQDQNQSEQDEVDSVMAEGQSAAKPAPETSTAQAGNVKQEAESRQDKKKQYTYAVKPEGDGFVIESDNGGGLVLERKPSAPGILGGTPARIFKTAADAREYMRSKGMGEALVNTDQEQQSDEELGSIYRAWVSKNDHRISAYPSDETLKKYAKFARDILDGNDPLTSKEDFERFMRLREYSKQWQFDLITTYKAFDNGQDVMPDGTLKVRGGKTQPATKQQATAILKDKTNEQLKDIARSRMEDFNTSGGSDKLAKEDSAAAVEEIIRRKKSEYDAGMKQAQDSDAATAILDRANVTGKDRLDIMRDFKDGKHSLADLEAAYPAKAEPSQEANIVTPEQVAEVVKEIKELRDKANNFRNNVRGTVQPNGVVRGRDSGKRGDAMIKSAEEMVQKAADLEEHWFAAIHPERVTPEEMEMARSKGMPVPSQPAQADQPSPTAVKTSGAAILEKQDNLKQDEVLKPVIQNDRDHFTLERLNREINHDEEDCATRSKASLRPR